MSEMLEGQKIVQGLIQQGNAAKMAEVLQQGNKAHIVVKVEKFKANSGNVYDGMIIFRRPSPMDYLKMGAEKSRLFTMLGIAPMFNPETGAETMVHVEVGIQRLASALAMFRVLLENPVPEWLQNYETMYDTDLVFYIYDLWEAGLLSFRLPNENGPTGNSEAGTDQEAVDGEEAVRRQSGTGGPDTSAE